MAGLFFAPSFDALRLHRYIEITGAHEAPGTTEPAMNAAAHTLSDLARLAIDEYVTACGNLVTPTLSGLLDTEAASFGSTWAHEGYHWHAVKVALTDAWAAAARG